MACQLMTVIDMVLSTPGRVDPLTLLQSLASLLGAKGNVRGMQEIEKIAKMMQECLVEKKLVSQCTYLNVLQATEDAEVLQRFINVGGWNTLNEWLNKAKETDNTPLLLEVLKVYGQMPVTVELLKQNSCAKTIKQLSKSEDEVLKKEAGAIVDLWMKKVAGNKSSSSSNEKSKKHKHKTKSKDRTSENGDGSPQGDTRHSHHSHKDHNHRSKSKGPAVISSRKDSGEASDDSSASSSVSDDRQGVITDNSSNNRQRPKTVKTVPTKFRSTGLEQESTSPPNKKKSTDKVATKRPSQSKSALSGTPPDKKSRTDASLTNAKDAEPKKPPPPKPKPPIHEIYESTGFMDALTPSSVPPLRIRKRKVSNTAEKHMSDDKKAAVVKEKVEVSVIKEEPSSPPKTEDKAPAEEEKESGETKMEVEESAEVKSPEEKKLVLPSFYKDTLETEEDKKAEESKKKEGEEAKEDMSDNQSEASTSSKTSETAPKKKKKKVSWVEEKKLKVFHYFELDENERVNVNRLKDFEDIKKKEMMMEKEMFAGRRGHGQTPHSGDLMGEGTRWRCPPLISLPSDSLPPRGCNSTERDAQKKREEGVLFALYFSKNMIPESAGEPDPETVSPQEPKVIPLEDETGTSGQVVYQDYPKPVADMPPASTVTSITSSASYSLPPDVADLLASLAGQHQPLSTMAQYNTGTGFSGQGQMPSQGQTGGDSQMLAQLQMQLQSGDQNMQNLLNSVMQGGTIEGLSDDLLNTLKDVLAFQQPPTSQSQGGPQWGGPVPAPSGMPSLMGGPPSGPPPPFGPPGRMMGPGGPQGPGGPMPPFGGPQGPPPGGMMGGPGPGGMMRGPPMGPPGPPGPMNMMRPRGRGGQRFGPNAPVCRHFMSGHCRYGSSCHNIHPGVNAPPMPGMMPMRGGGPPPSGMSPQHGGMSPSRASPQQAS